MSKTLRYTAAYSLWFVDIGISAWLFFMSRTALLAFLAFNDPGDYQYEKTAELVDKVFTLLFGICWLAFIFIVEEYFRTGALKGNLMKRFARITGPVLLVIFTLDLALYWLQGVSVADWLRWLILSSELIIGLVLIVYGRKTMANKPA